MQSSATQTITTAAVLEAFRMKTSAKTNEKTARSFRWASESLERFVSSRSEDITLQPFSASLIRDWCTWLLYQGYTKSTVLNYLKSLRLLHSELVADGLTTDLSIFTILHDILQSLPDTAFGNKQNTDVLKKLRHLIASSLLIGDSTTLLSKNTSLPIALLIFSLLIGGCDFSTLSRFPKSRIPDTHPLFNLIAERFARPRNKYLFPLDQPYHTPKQLREKIRQLFQPLLSTADLSLSLYVDDTPLDLWIRLAYEIGITPSLIKACVGEKASKFPMLAVAADLTSQDLLLPPLTDSERTPVVLSEQDRGEIRELVNDVLIDRTTHWYAFRFRRGTTLEKITARIAAFPDEFIVSQLYYPCDEIAKRVGNRLIIKRQPIVAGLLFIKCRYLDVVAIIRNLGDLMWCYTHHDTCSSDGTVSTFGRRSATTPGTTATRNVYAVIPDWQMDVYRTAINHLFPDTDLQPLGTIEPAPGDKIEIIGGDFIGRVGTFEQPTPIRRGTSSGRTLYRLIMPGGNGIEWVVDIPAASTRRITPAQYDKRLHELSHLDFPH